MKRYPEYKDSHIAWLGEIPSHWEIIRGKYLYRKMRRPVNEFDEVITCFRDGTVTLRKNRRLTGFTESLKEIGYQGIRKGDLVIHIMDAFAGAIGVSDSDGKGTPVYSVCQAIGNSNNKYFAYVLREMARCGYIQSLYRGIRERSSDFRFDVFAKQYYPVPPLSEQDKIARYLDYKVSRINKLISLRKKQLIGLAELKKVIINNSVTKGLNPNAELKQSGVKWLGEIPAHWEISRIKRICKFIGSGTTPDSGNSLYYGGGINWIQSGDLYHKNFINDTEKTITELAIKNCSALKIYQPPFIVVAMYGASIGNTSIVNISACVNQACCVLIPNDDININYMYYYLKFCQENFISQSAGGTQPNINQRKIKEEPFIIPPYQNKIKSRHISTAFAAKSTGL